MKTLNQLEEAKKDISIEVKNIIKKFNNDFPNVIISINAYNQYYTEGGSDKVYITRTNVDIDLKL